MKILGIETSCDETAASVVEDGHILHSNVVSSSVDLHQAYGGVVPEIAARSHIEVIIPVIEQALSEASCDWNDIDAIAATYGPGLNGSLLIGVMTARTLAIVKNKPLYAVNHVAAHPFAAFITDKKNHPAFPALALIVSGGHTQLVIFQSPIKYEVLGRTTDDAVGEAFDKVAKILGLPYPGGPSVASAAQNGNPSSVKLPIAKVKGKYDFSYSGLKTAVLRASQTLVGEDYTFPSSALPERLSEGQKADLAASFQNIAIKSLVEKTVLAVEGFRPASLIVAGGVAANNELRNQIAKAVKIPLFLPDIKVCTDNGAMIAAYAYYMASNSIPEADKMRLAPKPDLSM